MSTLTVIGNVGGDPELRYTPTGIPVCKFSVAETPRVRQADGTYKDGETVFHPIVVWREMAETVAGCVKTGMRVVVVGRLGVNKWEKDGVKHQRHEITADEVAASMKFANVKVNKLERTTAPAARTATSSFDGEVDPWMSNGR